MLSELGKYLGGSKMRVIFMGTPDFSVGTLEAIIEAGHEVALVVTQPDNAVYTGQGVCAFARY